MTRIWRRLEEQAHVISASYEEEQARANSASDEGEQASEKSQLRRSNPLLQQR